MRETRIVQGELRCGMAGDAMRVSGVAAKYNNPTVIQQGRTSFKEVLLPGAFRKAVDAKQDTAFLINHDRSRLPLGRVSSGTLRLRDAADGLHFECDFPDTEEARSAYVSIQRGDMHGCSFGFGTDTGDDEWSMERGADGKAVAVRKIRNISALEDVSAVTFPAYPNTSVNARSQEFENRSAIEIPAGLIVEEPETDSIEEIERRRRLFNIALL